MFGHKHAAVVQQAPTNEALSSMTISFQFHLNRLPENLPNNSNVSTSNTYSGVFGKDKMDRLSTYMYIFDVTTETNAAIARDKNGKDIVSKFKAVISGFQGERPFSATFTDVYELHYWLQTHHVIPNLNDGNDEHSYFDKDGVKVTEKVNDNEEYKRYIDTHIANPLMLTLKQQVNTLNSDKRELEKKVQSLTNEVKRMEKVRLDKIDSESRARASQHRAAMSRAFDF